jgi:mono/diheme cytochrome c family protein
VALAFRLARPQHVERRPGIGGGLEDVPVDPRNDALYLLALISLIADAFAGEIGDRGAPVRIAATSNEPILLAAASGSVTVLAQADTSAPKPQSTGTADTAHGRELFNSNCGHCHGQNAASPESRTDLCKLQRRYGEQSAETFETTVHDGRADKGMPPWKGVLPEGDIAAIKAYVFSVQQAK